jgi:thiaminase/transcriptional activator TenA
MSTTTLLDRADVLREQAMPIWQKIIVHPYLRELRDGTLPLETFAFYVQQDWLYLLERAKAFEVIARRSTNPQLSLRLQQFAVARAQMLEQHFHRRHAAELGLDLDNITWEMNEANWAYTNHQYAAAHNDTTAESLAAILPCGTIYQWVGQQLGGAKSPHPIYADWIAFYSSPTINQVVKDLVDAYNIAASEAGPEVLARCERNYLISSRYEWWFWDAAYRRQMWSV